MTWTKGVRAFFVIAILACGAANALVCHAFLAAAVFAVLIATAVAIWAEGTE